MRQWFAWFILLSWVIKLAIKYAIETIACYLAAQLCHCGLLKVTQKTYKFQVILYHYYFLDETQKRGF